MVPVPAMQSKKQGCISDLDDVLASFPTRKKRPKEIPTRKRAQPSYKGACIYCTAFYQQNQEIKDAIFYQRAVHCTAMICNYYCLENEAVCT
eukprot:14748344-Ditylum_brightwellii.AAC.1